MRKMAITLVTSLLVACGGGGGGYSEEFRTSFMQSCESSSGGQTAYCQCALDHLEENGPEDETEITAADQQAAIQACQGEVTG